MPRRTFFSFHYQPDVTRAFVVRNSWLTREDRDATGFFDSSVFESKKRESDDSLRRFLSDGLRNTSVTCVLVGAETSLRRWVRYELFRSFMRGNGLLAIRIHGIKNMDGKTVAAGGNPFAGIAFAVDGEAVRFQEYMRIGWQHARDVGSMPFGEIAYNLGGRTHHRFDSLFPIYDWVADDGYRNIGSWIEAAATAAGR